MSNQHARTHAGVYECGGA